MNKTLYFRLPSQAKLRKIINEMKLSQILHNNRTCIYENGEMRMSVDETVARILLYDDQNDLLLEKMRNYFYG